MIDNKLISSLLPLCAAVIIFAGCNQGDKGNPITGDEIKSHIAVLANDSLQGRKPFTAGETKATAYISAQFKKLGLEPGNNGSYFQDVPMVEIKGTPTSTMSITGAKGNFSLKAVEDFVIFSRREETNIQLKNAPMIFAG